MKSPVSSIVMFLVAGHWVRWGSISTRSALRGIGVGWQSYLFNAPLLGGVFCADQAREHRRHGPAGRWRVFTRAWSPRGQQAQGRQCDWSQKGLVPLSPHAHHSTVQGLSKTTFSGVTSVPR